MRNEKRLTEKKIFFRDLVTWSKRGSFERCVRECENTIAAWCCYQLHCVFRSPFSGRTIMSTSVCFEELSNIWNQWVIGIGISEKTADWEQNLANGQGRTPLILQNVQTDASIRVDVTVVDASCEMNLWRLEWIVRRKVDIEKENSSGIRRVIWSHDCCLPVKHIISNRACRTVGRRVFSQVDKFFIDSL